MASTSLVKPYSVRPSGSTRISPRSLWPALTTTVPAASAGDGWADASAAGEGSVTGGVEGAGSAPPDAVHAATMTTTPTSNSMKPRIRMTGKTPWGQGAGGNTSPYEAGGPAGFSGDRGAPQGVP